MQVIYIDEVFLINFIIDYLIIISAAKISGIAVKRIRAAAASVFGAVYSVLTVFSDFASLITIKVIVGAVIVLIAFGMGRNYLRLLLVFLASSASFAGAVMAVSVLSGYNGSLKTVSFKVLALSFGISWFIFSTMFRHIAKHRVEGTISELEIELRERKIKISALEDTGNSLKDPITGSSVIICGTDTAAALFDMETRRILHSAKNGNEAETLKRLSEVKNGISFCLIPCSTVSGRGMLLAFRPTSIKKNGKNIKSLVALSHISQGNGYSALTGTV